MLSLGPAVAADHTELQSSGWSDAALAQLGHAAASLSGLAILEVGCVQKGHETVPLHMRSGTWISAAAGKMCMHNGLLLLLSSHAASWSVSIAEVAWARRRRASPQKPDQAVVVLTGVGPQR